ncbi:transcription factor TFIIIC subunit [Martiniozyma asiatica (nom. inval.)]|nr:transcription factor TFIIIC subunit [Martiniozyma asiatica]
MSINKDQAQVFSLDAPSLISIEYPMRVKNLEKAIEIVGGKKKLSKCFIEPDLSLELHLRPDDPYSHPLFSTAIKNSEDVLLKIKIPKKIMSKHKGKINEALAECERKGKKYHVEPIGIMRQNYKFRLLADFQILPRNNEFVKEFGDSVRTGELDKIKEFSGKLESRLNAFQTFTNGDMNVPPLPRFARTDISHGYKYHGNLLLDEQGEWLNKAVKLHTIQIKWGEPVPIEHDAKLNKELEKAKFEIEQMKANNVPERILVESPSYHLIQCLKILEKLFEMKPVWIRKHIYLMLPIGMRPQLRFALPFVSYTCSKGPWRHSFIKLGYDPSKDPTAAKYQIEAFRSTGANSDDNIVEKNEKYIIPPLLLDYADEFTNENSTLSKLKVKSVPKSLLFDGETASNCLSFQLGDILDEDIKQLLLSAKLEDTCHRGSGWLNWLTISRIKIIIKYKLTCIRDNIPVDADKVQELMAKTSFQKSIINGVLPPDITNMDKQSPDVENDLEVEEEEEEVEEEEEEEEEEYRDDIIKRLKKFNPKSMDFVKELESFVKQENVMAEFL